MIYRIAQVNVARLRAPLDSFELTDFVAALAPVNASADQAPGFLWRLQTEDGNSTSIRAFEWDVAGSAGVIVNLSVWETIEQLSEWVNGAMHRSVLLQRRKWFERVAEATTALWWIPDGHLPSTSEAESRVRELRQRGPTQSAFTFRNAFAPPDQLESSSSQGAERDVETS
jgi:hypothetical protein